MSSQLGLFPLTRYERMREDFHAFHQQHPEVYRLFARFVAELLERGFTNYSADAVIHRVRWHTQVEARDGEGFKINDHFVAFYARLWMREHPEHEGFFRIREQTSRRRDDE